MLFKNIGQVLSRQDKADAAEQYLVDGRDEADRQNLAKFRWESRMHLSAMAETFAQHRGSTQHGAVSFEDRLACSLKPSGPPASSGGSRNGCEMRSCAPDTARRDRTPSRATRRRPRSGS